MRSLASATRCSTGGSRLYQAGLEPGRRVPVGIGPRGLRRRAVGCNLCQSRAPMGSDGDAEAWHARATAIADVARASRRGRSASADASVLRRSTIAARRAWRWSTTSRRAASSASTSTCSTSAAASARPRATWRHVSAAPPRRPRARAAEASPARRLTARAESRTGTSSTSPPIPARLAVRRTPRSRTSGSSRRCRRLGRRERRARREAFRVLRPGGHLGVQELIAIDEADRRAPFPPTERSHEDAVPARGLRRDRAPRRERRGRGSTRRAQVAAWDRLVRRLGDDDAYVCDRRALADAHHARRARRRGSSPRAARRQRAAARQGMGRTVPCVPPLDQLPGALSCAPSPAAPAAARRP